MTTLLKRSLKYAFLSIAFRIASPFKFCIDISVPDTGQPILGLNCALKNLVWMNYIDSF